MCGVTRRDHIRNEHYRGTTNYSGKKTEVIRPCVPNEDERGAHSEKNAISRRVPR